MTPNLIPLLPLTACHPSDGVARKSDSGDPLPHDDGAPTSCIETSRITVGDPTFPADGLDFSPSQAIGTVAGTWTGILSFTDGSTDDLTLTLSTPNTLQIVAVVLAQEDGDDTGLALGKPSSACPPFYEIGMAASFALAGGGLAETWILSVKAEDPEVQSFRVTEALSDIVGTSRPTSFEPDDWAVTLLFVESTFDGAAWSGSVAWHGSAEGESKGEGEDEGEGGGNGDGATETGGIEPSGIVELLGSFEADTHEE